MEYFDFYHKLRLLTYQNNITEGEPRYPDILTVTSTSPLADVLLGFLETKTENESSSYQAEATYLGEFQLIQDLSYNGHPVYKTLGGDVRYIFYSGKINSF